MRRVAGRGQAAVAVGIAGTAKNTGKTTSLRALMDECGRRGWGVCVTGIGFDGEDLDNVTRLPKPRIPCRDGVLVATALDCLGAGDAEVAVEHETGIETALGRVCVGTVRRAGFVVIAGPNKSSDLSRLLRTIRARPEPPAVILVDGAFGRIAPMGVCDGLFIATGAARNPVIGPLATETRSMVKVFDIPKVGPRTGGGDDIEVRGVASPAALHRLAETLGPGLSGRSVIVSSPTCLLASGDPPAIEEAMERISSLGGSLRVRRRPALLGVTVNPFFPVRLSEGRYETGRVDEDELLSAFRMRIGRPVWDVVAEGAAGMADAVESLASGMGGCSLEGEDGGFVE
ncbi:MAG: hypothetical protein NUV93_07290 [Firmicutes bacterium]|jgi:hypothetical protein|nr:hypothetical protein [Bacillota bacterium]